VDPVALIVAALAAGAGPTAQDETSNALKRAYARLREAVRQRLSRQPDGWSALARHEADPQAGRSALARELARAKAEEDAGLVAAAMELMGLAQEADKYKVPISRSQGVQVGDNNMQINYFIGDSVDLRDVGAAGSGPTGRLLEEVTDPFALEVHRPAHPDDPQPGLPALPAYVPREHDHELAEVVHAAAGGTSGIAVLVGGSSTGKTRACWEALRLLRDQPQPWRLWHPIDPGRPEAALRGLTAIGPRTVVWLNEAQFYLDVAVGGLGERVAAGLRELLRDPAGAPVLVLATIWPQYWDTLTTRPAAAADPHAQARELLAGRDIAVPAAFTADQVQTLASAADRRLALAAEAAKDGQVVQFLAGAPELMARYRNAQPAAAALMNAAIDARRLGMGAVLPLAFLEHAAPGYLTDDEWDGLGDDWLESALTYSVAWCKGVRGPLVRIRSRPASVSGPSNGRAYRLADYLEQQGRRFRRPCIPPEDFWKAAACYAALSDIPALASAAEDRGLLRDAARLRKSAGAKGNASEAAALIRTWYSLYPHSTDPRPAQWAVVHADLRNPGAVATLLDTLREAGAQEQIDALIASDPAALAELEHTHAVADLLLALRMAGAQDQADAFAARASAHADLHEPFALPRLLVALLVGRPKEEGIAAAARAAAQVDLHDPRAVLMLLDDLRTVGAEEQADALIARGLAAHADLHDPRTVAGLLDALRKAGAQEQMDALAARTADLRDPLAAATLLDPLRKAGARGQADALAARATAHVDLGDPFAVVTLLDALLAAGAQEQIDALISRDPASCADLQHRHVGVLLDALLRGRAQEQADALVARDPAAHADLRDPFAVGWLLHALREAGAQEQAEGLIARDPAAHATLNDLDAIAILLDALRRAGAQEQARALAGRVAAQAELEDPFAVALVLDLLREAGIEDRVRALVERLPAQGQFALFREQADSQMRFRFGRELDGSPALPWSWDDLDQPRTA
jgi:uncharacterized protein YidB (DUF937 family)